MNNKLLLIALTALALAGCQDNKAPATQTSTGQAGTASSAQHTANAPTSDRKNQIAAASGNAVSVAKPPENAMARKFQEALDRSEAQMKATAKQASESTPITEKPAAVKPLAAKANTLKEPVAKPADAIAAEIPVASKPAEVQKPIITAKPELVTPPAPAAIAGDVAKGKSLARKCAICHRFSDKKKVGPGLKAVVGRKAGIMPDMKYSPALAAGGWVWSSDNLASWVCDSKQAVKVLSGDPNAKTRMSAQRICDPTKQADLIAFLKTL